MLCQCSLHCGNSETGGKEERFRTQSIIEAEEVSVFCVSLCLGTYLYMCTDASESLQAVLWPLALPLICPFLRDFRQTGPSLLANAGPAKPRWAVWVPPTCCSFLSLLLSASLPHLLTASTALSAHPYLRICHHSCLSWISGQCLEWRNCC